jgi:hypothetical protein
MQRPAWNLSQMKRQRRNRIIERRLTFKCQLRLLLEFFLFHQRGIRAGMETIVFDTVYLHETSNTIVCLSN